MQYKLLVHVRRKDVDSACSLQSRNCPIAWALKRTTGTLWSVSKSTATRVEHGAKFGISRPLPMRARLFVHNFDRNNGRARPFVFFLNVPAKTYHNAIAHRARIQKKRRNLERRRAKWRATEIAAKGRVSEYEEYRLFGREDAELARYE